MPPKPDTTELTNEFFQSHEEYYGLRFNKGTFIAQQVEHLVLRQVEFRNVSLDASQLYSSRLVDVHLSESSLANTNCERIFAQKVEISGCRLTGLNGTEGHFQNVQFRACNVQLARFRFCTFKAVTFEDCDLKDANFQGADLSGVSFKRCDLSNVEMSQAKLAGTDLRTSKIDGLKVGPEEVVGAVVDHFQAAYLASLLGLVIKNDDEK